MLQLIEAAARGGVLALLLALLAVGWQHRELTRIREMHADCEAMIGALRGAVRELHMWASLQNGKGRKVKLPALSSLLAAPPDDDEPSS